MSEGNRTRLGRPAMGRLGRLLGPFNITGVFWFQLHIRALRVLPRWTWYALVPVFTTVFFLTLFRIRRAVAANLEMVLGPCGFAERQRRIFRTFSSLAWCLHERFEHYSGARRCETVQEGREHWDRATGSGRGLILVTAHIGAWESGTLLPAPRTGRRVHVVREMEADPRSQEVMREMIERQVGDLYAIHFASDDPGLGVELLQALRSGEVVALQGDRPTEGGQAVEATLFGRPFQLPAGPLALARAADVELLPVYILREDRLFYRLVFRTPIRVPRTRDRAADLREAAGRLAANLEETIRDKPHQWFCWNELWPEKASGSGSGLRE